MEQVMRNIERARALRINAIAKADPADQRRPLSTYFAGPTVKAKGGVAKRLHKSLA